MRGFLCSYRFFEQEPKNAKNHTGPNTELSTIIMPIFSVCLNSFPLIISCSIHVDRTLYYCVLPCSTLFMFPLCLPYNHEVLTLPSNLTWSACPVHGRRTLDAHSIKKVRNCSWENKHTAMLQAPAQTTVMWIDREAWPGGQLPKIPLLQVVDSLNKAMPPRIGFKWEWGWRSMYLQQKQTLLLCLSALLPFHQPG